MNTTFPEIKRYTKAVLISVCDSNNITIEGYRLATLKLAECEIGNMLEHNACNMSSEYREVIEGLHKQIRCAIADE